MAEKKLGIKERVGNILNGSKLGEMLRSSRTFKVEKVQQKMDLNPPPIPTVSSTTVVTKHDKGNAVLLKIGGVKIQRVVVAQVATSFISKKFFTGKYASLAPVSEALFSKLSGDGGSEVNKVLRNAALSVGISKIGNKLLKNSKFGKLVSKFGGLEKITGRLFKGGLFGNKNKKGDKVSKVGTIGGTQQSNSLVDKFVYFIPLVDMPSNFFIYKESAPIQALLTKVGSDYEIMRVRIISAVDFQVVSELYMLVNPNSKSVKFDQSHSEVITRAGASADYWGVSPVQITVDGASGGFYGPELSGENSGYGSRNFLKSLSFKNILSLVSFYKNNGYVYNRRFGGTVISSSDSGIISRDREVAYVNNVEIIYRDVIYTGSFDSMSLTLDTQKTNMCTYSFTFSAYRHRIA